MESIEDEQHRWALALTNVVSLKASNAGMCRCFYRYGTNDIGKTLKPLFSINSIEFISQAMPIPSMVTIGLRYVRWFIGTLCPRAPHLSWRRHRLPSITKYPRCIKYLKALFYFSEALLWTINQWQLDVSNRWSDDK